MLRRFLLAEKLRTGRDGDDLLFGRSAREPFTPTHVGKRAREAWAAAAVGSFVRGERSELEPIGPHECRHGYVSLMHAAGCSLEEIDDFVGHSSTYMGTATAPARRPAGGRREAARRLPAAQDGGHGMRISADSLFRLLAIVVIVWVSVAIWVLVAARL
jgi:integrase